jgi:hypothetical protein
VDRDKASGNAKEPRDPPRCPWGAVDRNIAVLRSVLGVTRMSGGRPLGTAKDHNRSITKWAAGVIGVWRPSSEVAEDRNDKGEEQEDPLAQVAAVLRSGRGSQPVSLADKHGFLSQWRPPF